jgi:transcriptional regulator of aromatic amino acid metabolism
VKQQLLKGRLYFCGSLLFVEAADRPGLLVDLVKAITDINIAVESGEFDTEVIIYLHTSAPLDFLSFPLYLSRISQHK